MCTNVKTKIIGVHKYAPQKRQITGVQGIVHQVIWCTLVVHTKNCSGHTSGTPKSESFLVCKGKPTKSQFSLVCMQFFSGVKSVQPYVFYSRRKAFIFKKENTDHQNSDIFLRRKTQIIKTVISRKE